MISRKRLPGLSCRFFVCERKDLISRITFPRDAPPLRCQRAATTIKMTTGNCLSYAIVPLLIGIWILTSRYSGDDGDCRNHGKGQFSGHFPKPPGFLDEVRSAPIESSVRARNDDKKRASRVVRSLDPNANDPRPNPLGAASNGLAPANEKAAMTFSSGKARRVIARACAQVGGVT